MYVWVNWNFFTLEKNIILEKKEYDSITMLHNPLFLFRLYSRRRLNRTRRDRVENCGLSDVRLKQKRKKEHGFLAYLNICFYYFKWDSGFGLSIVLANIVLANIFFIVLANRFYYFGEYYKISFWRTTFLLDYIIYVKTIWLV